MQKEVKCCDIMWSKKRSPCGGCANNILFFNKMNTRKKKTSVHDLPFKNIDQNVYKTLGIMKFTSSIESYEMKNQKR